MGRSWDLDDELDALLDASPEGSRTGRCGELAPLVEVAAALRAELSAVQIDPGAARQHLSRVTGAPRFAPAGSSSAGSSLSGPSHSGSSPAGSSLNGSGRRIGTEIPAQPVPLPVGRPRSRLRRRVTMVALAAALALVPATMVSASSLPGHPLYPLKRSVEQVRLAALVWSPAGSAREHLRIADVRAAELAGLVRRKAVGRVPDAITALQNAVDAAGKAVDEASLREGDSGRGVALRQDLAEVTNDQIVQLASVSREIPTTSPAAQQAIEAAKEALVSAKLRQEQQGGASGQVTPATTSAPPTSSTSGALLPALVTGITTTTVAAGAAQVASSTTVGAREASASNCGERPATPAKRRQWAKCLLAAGQPVDPEDLAAAPEDAEAR
ncbi:MAG TPA: DUF5667 domain-containing protein [Actinomycetes bacterium]|nr:DUF5667 domain-containing protein [Actinomycetes bacterium]